MHPLVVALLALGTLCVVDAKVKPLGLSRFNPLSPKEPERLPPPTPAAVAGIPIAGSPSVIVPPISTLPPQAGLPQLPTDPAGSLNQSLGALASTLPQVDKVPPFVPGVLDNGPQVVVGDTINVDMFKSGMAIPQNLPVVGLVFMNVDSLAVTGDIGKQKLIASFLTPELRPLGPQIINRSSIVEKVGHGGVAIPPNLPDALRLQVITALNTPEGDRSPEATALILGLASQLTS